MKTRLAGTDAQVVVLKEAQGVLFVKTADPLQDIPAHQKTKACESLNPQRLASKFVSPFSRKGINGLATRSRQ
jgi:hypothetical protein